MEQAKSQSLSSTLNQADLENLTTVPYQIVSLKSRLKQTWMSGNYGYFARYLTPSAAEFFGRLGVVAGMRVLDVACGSGQLTLMAARAGADVTGIDIATNSILQARLAAQRHRLKVKFDEGDAESLPYGSALFDLVISAIGAMFAPNPDLVAAEMIRVCRRGGRIAMANWTMKGFVGSMFDIMGGYTSLPTSTPTPMLWGEEDVVRARFGSRVRKLRTRLREYDLRYPFSPSDVVEFYRIYYGPINQAFALLGPTDSTQLRRDLVRLWSEHNIDNGYGTHVKAEYLEVVAERV